MNPTLAEEIFCDDMPTTEETWAHLRAALAPATVIRRDEPLARRTTLRVGGPADFLVEPAGEEELSVLLKFCRRQDLPVFVLGRGSNLLIRDGGIRGVVISLAHADFSRIEIEGTILRCGAGARLKQVAVEARRAGVSGLEFLEGIPGSVGGALRMNAGAMGAATGDVVESIRLMDFEGRVSERGRSEVPWTYRSCPLLREQIALGAVLRGQALERDEIAARMAAFSRKRWDTQPAAPSAGCIFKNPETIPAGKLIDELGLKALRVGGASVSLEHGNFIVNDGTASAADVLQLIGRLQEKAREARGIDLRTEVEIVGEA